MDPIQLSKARCRALVVSCSDFRFISAQRQIRLDLGLDNAYDLLARPGGVFSLVRSASKIARKSMLEEIDLLRSLHHFQSILLMNHVTCGAYRDLARGKREMQMHREDLLRAKAMLEELYPGMRVTVYLSTIVEDGVEVVPVDSAAMRPRSRASARPTASTARAARRR